MGQHRQWGSEEFESMITIFWDDIDMNMGMNDDTNFPMPDEISGIGASTSADWEASDPSLWLDSGFTNPEYHSAVL